MNCYIFKEYLVESTLSGSSDCAESKASMLKCETCKKLLEAESSGTVDSSLLKEHDHNSEMSCASHIKENTNEVEEEEATPFIDLAKFYPLLCPPSSLKRYVDNLDVSEEVKNRELDGTEIVNETFSFHNQPYVGYNRFYSHEIFLRYLLNRVHAKIENFAEI